MNGITSALCANASRLTAGERLVADNNTVMHNKRLSFTCELKDGLHGLIRLGHGKEDYASAYLELTEKEITVYQHFAETSVSVRQEHGLELCGALSIFVAAHYGTADITISSPGGILSLGDIAWYGRNGDVFAECEGTELENVSLKWYCPDYAKKIYLFGDSYLNALSPERWTHYLHLDGFDGCFMTGFPGMGCERGAVDLKLAAGRGRPDYAVWLLGMNNGDNGCISPAWLGSVTELLKICDASGITPILSTVPSTPKVDNSFKNAWVRGSGVRYIDMERAVGADKNKQWYPGMLAPDLIHPAAPGAQALYMQMLADMPELSC